MYCSSCGAEASLGLNYCKHCGLELSGAQYPKPTRSPSLVLVAMFLAVIGMVATCGIVVPLGIGEDLVGHGVNGRDLAAIYLCSSAMTLFIVGLLIWLLTRLLKTFSPAREAVDAPSARQIRYRPAQIAAAPPAASSVTEHTTRNFDRIERGSIRGRGRDTA